MSELERKPAPSIESTAISFGAIGEPIIATPEECRRAVLRGRLVVRDKDASYWSYDQKIYVLPALPSTLKPES